MKLASLFNKVWVCQARVFFGYRCTPQDHEEKAAATHGGCGWRYQASYLPADFEPMADLEVIVPEEVEK